MSFDRSRANVGLVHPTRGVIAWHPRILNRHYDEAQAESANSGVRVVVREVRGWGEVPEGYGGPLTISPDGIVSVFEPESGPDAQAFNADIEALQEIADTTVPPPLAVKTIARILLKVLAAQDA